MLTFREAGSRLSIGTLVLPVAKTFRYLPATYSRIHCEVKAECSCSDCQMLTDLHSVPAIFKLTASFSSLYTAQVDCSCPSCLAAESA